MGAKSGSFFFRFSRGKGWVVGGKKGREASEQKKGGVENGERQRARAATKKRSSSARVVARRGKKALFFRSPCSVFFRFLAARHLALLVPSCYFISLLFSWSVSTRCFARVCRESTAEEAQEKLPVAIERCKGAMTAIVDDLLPPPPCLLACSAIRFFFQCFFLRPLNTTRAPGNSLSKTPGSSLEARGCRAS